MAKTKRSFDAELRDSKIQRETLWMKVDDPLENFRVRIEAGTERSLQKWTDITEVGGSKGSHGTVFFHLGSKALTPLPPSFS